MEGTLSNFKQSFKKMLNEKQSVKFLTSLPPDLSFPGMPFPPTLLSRSSPTSSPRRHLSQPVILTSTPVRDKGDFLPGTPEKNNGHILVTSVTNYFSSRFYTMKGQS